MLTRKRTRERGAIGGDRVEVCPNAHLLSFGQASIPLNPAPQPVTTTKSVEEFGPGHTILEKVFTLADFEGITAEQ